MKMFRFSFEDMAIYRGVYLLSIFVCLPLTGCFKWAARAHKNLPYETALHKSYDFEAREHPAGDNCYTDRSAPDPHPATVIRRRNDHPSRIFILYDVVFRIARVQFGILHTSELLIHLITSDYI